MERLFEAEDNSDEEELTDFDSDVEEEKGGGDFAVGEAERGKAAGESEAVEKSEGECDDPGVADGEAGLAAHAADDFGSEEEDGESDGGVEGEEWGAGIAEGGDGECDAMGKGEGRDGLEECPAIGDDKHQAEDKEEVIDAHEDVLDAESGVGEGEMPEAGMWRWMSKEVLAGLRRVTMGEALRGRIRTMTSAGT